MLKGADISKWQGIVDFSKFKTSVDFVIIRSSYNEGSIDGQLVRNRDESRKAGLLVGYYHYAYPGLNDAELEAEWFCKVASPKAGEIMCLDFEEQYPDPVGWSLKFLDRVSNLLNGYKPMIYLNQALVKGNNWKPVIDKNYGLWLAQYDYNPNGQPVKTPWEVVAMRQYSNKETFPGISGNVDGNVFYGTKETFLSYGYKPSNTVPAPTPAPTIEKLPKDSVVNDIYQFLTGESASQDELKWRLESNKNLVEIGNDICAGDSRFFNRWVKPQIPNQPDPEPLPIPQPIPPTEPTPNPVVCSDEEAIKAVKNMVSKQASIFSKLSFLLKLI